jgi:hypothetical protein
MISNFTKGILGRRPNIVFVAPRSGVTIPEPQYDTTPKTPKEEKVDSLIAGLLDVAAKAEIVEKIISEKAKNVKLTLSLNNPEDVVVAQAAARQFPEKAKEKDGFRYVDELTFDMYSHCIQAMKAAGKAAGAKQSIKLAGPFKADKTDFGGAGQDRRPDVNQATIPFAPIDIPGFVAAGIPLMFSLLFPLINASIKKDIIAHAHIDPISGVTGPGVPLLPV